MLIIHSTEYMIPQGDGQHLSRQFRELQSHEDIIILTSQHEDHET